jgi:multiple sugar transport system substrate-binding protein
MARMMTYRKSWLKELGMDVPDTWEEFLKAAEALTQPPDRYGFVQLLNKSDYGQTILLYPLVYNLGGKFWDKDLNPTLDTPEVIEAVKFLKKLYDVAHPPEAMNYNVSDTYRIWVSGLSAFSFEGIPLQIYAYNEAPEVFEDTGIAYIPRPASTPPEQRTNYTSPRVMLLMKKSPEVQKAAEKFMIFINQHDRKLDFLHTNPFMMPVQKSIANDPRFISGSEMLVKMKENVDMTYEGMRLGITGGLESGINPYSFLLERNTIEPMFHKIYLDNVPVEQAVKEAQADLEKRVEEQKQLIGW